jgi:hypothetical protein
MQIWREKGVIAAFKKLVLDIENQTGKGFMAHVINPFCHLDGNNTG